MGKKSRKERGDGESTGPQVEPVNGCHCPTGCSIGVAIVDGYSEDDVVHVVCTNGKCTQPTVVHSQCFDVWENDMLTLCQRARKTDMSVKWFRNHLWADSWGWRLISNQCECPCGCKMRKDLEYYQMKKTKEAVKEIKNAAKVEPKQPCAKQTMAKKKPPKVNLLPSKGSTKPMPCTFRVENFAPLEKRARKYRHSEYVEELPSKPPLPVGMSVENKQKKRRQKNKSECDLVTLTDTPSSISNTNSLIKGVDSLVLLDDSHEESMDGWEKVHGNNSTREPQKVAKPYAGPSLGSIKAAGLDYVNVTESYASSVADMGDMPCTYNVVGVVDYSIDAYLPYTQFGPVSDKYKAVCVQVSTIMQQLTDNIM